MQLWLPAGTVEGLQIAGEFLGKKFEGDVTSQLQVFGLVDHTHAPTADSAEDAVVRDSLSQRFGGSSHWLDMLGGALSEGQSKRGGANPDGHAIDRSPSCQCP